MDRISYLRPRLHVGGAPNMSATEKERDYNVVYYMKRRRKSVLTSTPPITPTPPQMHTKMT